MQCITRDLASMVEMISQLFEVAIHFFGCALPFYPARYHHPGIQRATNYGAPFYQGFDHFIAELAVMVYQRAAQVMTGPYRPVKMVERLPEGIVAQMRGVENDIQPLHFAEQGKTISIYFTRGIGAVGIPARTIMRGAYGS